MPISKQSKPSESSKPLTLKERLKAIETQDNSPHLIVEARAGTGKTTTLIEGLKKMLGVASEHPASLNPSVQQSLIWDCLNLSRGKCKSICFVAFNNSIAKELQERVPPSCSAMTMHSMGLKAVTKALGRCYPDDIRVDKILGEMLGQSPKSLRYAKPVVLSAVKKLVSLCKMNLTPILSHDAELGDDGWSFSNAAAHLSKLASHYDVDLEGWQNEIFDLVPRVLLACRNNLSSGAIDYDDMIWLPVALKLPVFIYDLLLVDEAQDLNRCQQALARLAGRRLVLCGDPFQAIYGFAGADSESMARMESELSETIVGCVKLPLTVTRRCSKEIVKEANQYVSDIEAHSSNSEGKITESSLTDVYSPSYRDLVEDGDMILCRVNAPLVAACLSFIRQGRKANIQGRDLSNGLIATLTRVCTESGALIESIAYATVALHNWLIKETSRELDKTNPSEQRIMAIEDREACLQCFLSQAISVSAAIDKIRTIFVDDKSSKGIRLSSIHKSKGLEAKRVFLLSSDQDGYAQSDHRRDKVYKPRPQWQAEQERNLLYVAITRAIEELVYVYVR